MTKEQVLNNHIDYVFNNLTKHMVNGHLCYLENPHNKFSMAIYCNRGYRASPPNLRITMNFLNEINNFCGENFKHDYIKKCKLITIIEKRINEINPL